MQIVAQAFLPVFGVWTFFTSNVGQIVNLPPIGNRLVR